MMDLIGIPMGAVMRFCYDLLQNYGLAIILFTVITKIILFPISLWVHVNGIKMVRIQPTINRLKVKYFGDLDTIADEQTKLYKQEKYNPFSGIVPIFVQLMVLIGLIQVIYHPLSYVLLLPDELVEQIIAVASTMGIDTASSSVELLALDIIQKSASLDAFASISGMTTEILTTLEQLQMNFLGFDLASVPITSGGILLLIPIFAGLASVILSLSQNKLNPLQAEQGKMSQLGTMLFSVGLSLVVGFMIPTGVGFYWIFSNLFTIAQQAVLNLVYVPKKHIDYQELAASKEELAKYENVGQQRIKRNREEIKREKADYKRFFSVINKHLVFYSERSGYYKYYEALITQICALSNLTIHYVTSDPNDQIFEIAKNEPKIKPYYIGDRKLITLFMKLETDVMVMTMPEIEKYHYKRSLVDKNIHYVYVFHAMVSTHMIYRSNAFDHYDAIFCVGPHHHAEIREAEALYQLPPKELVAFGYPLLDTLRDHYAKLTKRNDRFQVLIAPSHQFGNIMDTCLVDMLEAIGGGKWDIIVRPHPQYVHHNGEQLTSFAKQYENNPHVHFEMDFSSSDSIYLSDVLITDWSGIAMEYSFTTLKPCIFINTPMKVNNPEYQKWQCEPMQLRIRDQIGVSMNVDEVKNTAEVIEQIQTGKILNADMIEKMVDEYVYAINSHGNIGAQYLIDQIKERCQKRAQSSK